MFGNSHIWTIVGHHRTIHMSVLNMTVLFIILTVAHICKAWIPVHDAGLGIGMHLCRQRHPDMKLPK